MTQRTIKPGQLIFAFALMQGVVCFLTDGLNFTHEESMWHYIGRNWFHLGLTPYEGGVDNKSPLIFAVFGLSDYLFGLNFWFPRILGIACQCGGIYFLYRITLHLAAAQGADNAKRVGIITITVYSLSLMWRATGGKYVSFTETYAVTFLIIAVYYYLLYLPAGIAVNKGSSKNAFISGMLAGIAFGWRLSACFGIMAILIHALFKNRKALAPFAGGLIASVIALGVLAMAAGIDLNDIYVYAFAENFGSGSTTDHSLSRRVENFTMNFFYSELLLFYPPLIAYFFMKKQTGVPAVITSLLTIWLACEFIGINILGIYARPHFKHLLPALSLMSGISIAHLVNNYGFSMKHVMIAVWILFIPKITEPFSAFRKAVVAGESDRASKYCQPAAPRPDELAERDLGRWIAAHTGDSDRVLVAGYGARVQLYSKRLSPSIYFNVTQTPRAKEQFMKEVMSNKPAMIVIPVFPDYKVHVQEDLRAFIDSLVGREYNETENCAYGYAVYKRR